MKNLFVLSLIVLIITACDSNNRARQKSSDGHSHISDEVHQLTLFTDKSEIFVEYPGLIINKESEFAVHLTNLDNYQPYNDGTVRVILEHSGGKIQEGSVLKADVPGIFRVSITPETPGESSIHFEFTREGIS